MEYVRFKDILALKTAQGAVVGFHARNLQVAHLDDGVWKALQSLNADPSAGRTVEAKELEAWNGEVDPAARDSDIESSVNHLLVNIAQICNLKCGYCAAGGDGTYGDPMKHVEIETIYDQIRMFLHDVPPGGTFTITFFGGEPLLVPDTIKSLARFVKLQVAGRKITPRFSIVTNGTLVTEQIAELLASLNCHVTVSLDGPPEVNDKARPTKNGRGSTLLTLQGLERLKEVRDRLGSLTAGAVFGQHHTGVLETYKFLKPFDFDSIKFDFAAAEGDAIASEMYAIELGRTADYAFEQGGEWELRRIGLFDAYFRVLDQQRRVNNHCGAGKSHMTTDGRGRLTACQWFVGAKDDQLGFGAELDHDRVARYAGRLNELNDCAACWARHVCGGGCMHVNQVKTGAKHKKDEAFCARTRNTIAKAIEYYAQARYQTPGGDGCETH